MPGYIRHDSNNNPAGTQPTKIIVNELGGTTGWSTVKTLKILMETILHILIIVMLE